MKRLFLLALLFASFAFGQGQPTNQVLNPPPANWLQIFWCGSGFTACGTANPNTSAICSTPAWLSTKITYVVPATLTSIAVSSNVGTITFTAAQMYPKQYIVVAGSATTALNGVYQIQTASTTSATITTSGVSNATYTDMTVATQQPTMDMPVWAIQIFLYTNNSVTQIYYAGNPVNPQIPQGLACSSRASY